MHGDDLKEKQEKAGNPIFIIVIFVALVGFLFIVPEVYKKYNSQINSFFGDKTDEEHNPNAPTDEVSGVSAYYQLGAQGELDFNEITLTDIVLNTSNNTLSFLVEIEDDKETFDLEEAHYYVEFFKNKKTFLGRRVLLGKVTGRLNFELDLRNMNIDSTTYMVVSHIEDSSIVAPTDEEGGDEAGLQSFVCTKDNESYEYEFYLKKLTKVKYKYSYSNENLSEYADKVMEYQKIEKAYGEYTGVTTSIVDNSTNFVFLSEFDYGAVGDFNKIKDRHLYVKGLENYIVKFKIEAEGFECK